MGSTAHALNANAKPAKPIEPDPLDCCGSGCVRCVFDIYDEAVQRYREELAAWEASHSRRDESGDA